MIKSFCYDRRASYFHAQSGGSTPAADRRIADSKYAMMRYAGLPDIGDAFEGLSRIMRPLFQNRTRKWGGWGMAKPNNSKPRGKKHRG